MNKSTFRKFLEEMHAVYGLPGARPIIRSANPIEVKKLDKAPKTPASASKPAKVSKAPKSPTQASTPGAVPQAQLGVLAAKRELQMSDSQNRINSMRSNYIPGDSRNLQIAELQRKQQIQSEMLRQQAERQKIEAQRIAMTQSQPVQPMTPQPPPPSQFTPDRRRPYHGLDVSRLAPQTQRIHKKYSKIRK